MSVMHTIEDLVNLRSKVANLDGINVQFIKSLCKELRNYSDKVSSDKEKYFYECLSPNNVLFDQHALRPKLRFEPLLQDAAGLKKRPLSVEMLLTMFPTPKGFDYFQSLPELDEIIQLKLNDPFYGCFEIYGDNRLTAEVKEGI